MDEKSMDEKLQDLEDRIVALVTKIDSRIVGLVIKLSSRVSYLEHPQLSDIKNDLYQLETRLNGIESQVSGLERNIRY